MATIAGARCARPGGRRPPLLVFGLEGRSFFDMPHIGTDFVLKCPSEVTRVHKDTLKYLSDPLSPEIPLKMANKDILARINKLIAEKKLRNRAGEIIDTPITEALVNENDTRLYIVKNNIPILLPSKGIELEDLAD